MPEFDFDPYKFRKEFEESYKEEDEIVDDEEIVEDDEEIIEDDLEEVIDDEEVKDDEEEIVDEEVKQDDEATKTKKTQTAEENAAFAEMRRKNEALQRQAAVVEKAAARYGMTVDQYLAAVEEQEAKERAEKQGVPVDVLRRLESQEAQLGQLTVQQERERYASQITLVKTTHSLSDSDVDKVFAYVGQRGLVDGRTGVPIIPFEDAYKLANLDTITENKVKEAKQNDLAKKKARQKKSAIPHENDGTLSNKDTEEITDEFVLKRLQSRNLL